MIPACRVMVSEPPGVQAPSGSLHYLCLLLVEWASSLLFCSWSLSPTKWSPDSATTSGGAVWRYVALFFWFEFESSSSRTVNAPPLHFSLSLVSQQYDFLRTPNVIGQASGHCWSDPQRLV